MSGRLPWGRVLAEGVVIVASILLAFGIDAWWDDRGTRAEEALALRDLSSDFQQNLRSLESNIRHHRRTVDAGARLLEIVHRAEPVPVRAQLDSLLILGFGDHVTFDPRSAALDDLMASGRLGIIRDDVLRESLATWPTVLADYQQEELAVVRQVETSSLPFITAHVPATDLYNAAHAGFGSYPPSAQDPDIESLLGSLEFESRLANRMAQEHVVLRDIEQNVRPLLELILERLQSGSSP